MKQKVLDQYQSSPHPVRDETKSFGSTPLPYPLDATAKRFKMAIYIKSTILKLEKTRNLLEIVFLCILNMLNFISPALIATEM